MNLFVDKRYDEHIERLALGLEPIDAGRLTRLAFPIRVFFEERLLGLPRPRLERHRSCLHALRYLPGVSGTVKLRFQEDARRYVPRRISFPIQTIAAADAAAWPNRVRRPRMFPGAAYDVVSQATGLRGRVLRGTDLLRWARVEARIGGSIVGRAHGDDRGEFLLLLDSSASPVGDLVSPFSVRVDVFAPAVLPTPATADQPQLDPFWDLPPEIAAVLDPVHPEIDPVSAGETLPAGYTANANANINFQLGEVVSAVSFTIP